MDGLRGTKSFVISRSIVVISASVIAVSGAVSNDAPVTRSSSACYSSGDCGFHYLSCEAGLSIALRSTYYGFKDTGSYDDRECSSILITCGDYVNKTSCCEYEAASDCLQAYSAEHQTEVRTNCDGKRKCTFHAPYMSGSCDDPSGDYSELSTFSIIQYVCLNVSREEPANTATQSNQEDITKNDDDLQQLVIGVSVGVGVGVIALIIIAIVCWVRIRRKPAIVATHTQGPGAPRHNDVIRRPSANNTLTSSLPSSLLSSLYAGYSTSSSRPASVYSTPADVMSITSSVDRDTILRNYGYDDLDFRSGDIDFIDIRSGDPYFRPHDSVGRRVLVSSNQTREALASRVWFDDTRRMEDSRGISPTRGGFMSSTPQAGNERSGESHTESPVINAQGNVRRQSVTFQSPETITPVTRNTETSQKQGPLENGTPRTSLPMLRFLTETENNFEAEDRNPRRPPDANRHRSLPETPATNPQEKGRRHQAPNGDVYSIPEKRQGPVNQQGQQQQEKRSDVAHVHPSELTQQQQEQEQHQQEQRSQAPQARFAEQVQHRHQQQYQQERNPYATYIHPTEESQQNHQNQQQQQQQPQDWNSAATNIHTSEEKGVGLQTARGPFNHGDDTSQSSDGYTKTSQYGPENAGTFHKEPSSTTDEGNVGDGDSMLRFETASSVYAEIHL